MKQELPKPQGKIKQVIITKTETSCSVKHYGNPEIEELAALLGVHTVKVFEILQAANPEAEPEAIKNLILAGVEFAINVSLEDFTEDDDSEDELQ